MRCGRGTRCPRLRHCAHADAHRGTARHWTLLLTNNSLLRKLGFYGSLSMTSSDEFWHARLQLGYNLPMWFLSKSLSIYFHLASVGMEEIGCQVLPGHIRLQNRVPFDSPFLRACRQGDTKLINQHLLHRTGSVNERAWCSGRTPLMVCRARLQSKTFVDISV
jgi:hypothetical protein